MIHKYRIHINREIIDMSSKIIIEGHNIKEVNNRTATKEHKYYMDHIGKLPPRIVHSMLQALNNKYNIYFMKKIHKLCIIEYFDTRNIGM